MKRIPRILICLLLIISGYTNAQLKVTGGVSNATLMANLFGPGVTISNFNVNCGNKNEYGTFTATASTSLGLTSGVLLTNGSVNNAVGPNNSASAGTCVGTSSSDACLGSITTGQQYDDCIITFDIVPSCDTFNVSYIFGSEEYPEYVGSAFNDAFGFFVNGPKPGGGTYNCQNVALIPGTTTPVTINNVNSGKNSSYYRDNTKSTDPCYKYIQYDGLTVPMIAVIPVIPCQKYSMELAIADVSDCNYDSGVFLEYQGLKCVADQTLAVTPKNPTTCAGNPITLTASGMSTYTWAPATGLNVTTGATVIATPTATTTYVVTGSNACITEKDTVIVTVTPGPVLTVTPSAPSICSGGSVNLVASGSTGSYTWSPGTGLNVTTGSSVTANPASTATYTVSSTVGGCTGTKPVTVTVVTTPTINITPNAPSICSGNSVPLTASGAASYSWSPFTGLSATTGATVTANPTVTTTYTVNGANGACPGKADSVTVTVNTTPTLSIAPSAPTICPGGSVNLIVAGGGTGANYTWTPATNLSATTGDTVVANPASTITYTVTGTSAAGCPGNSPSVTVTVAASLNLGVTPASPNICIGDSTLLNATGAAAYSWKPATGLSCTNCPNPTAKPGTTTTYTLIGTSGSCSDSLTNVTVTVNPALPISITLTGIAAAICPSDSMGMIGNGATSYSWAPSTGLNCTTCDTVWAKPTSTTTYTLTGSNGSCQNSVTQVITVYPVPVINVTPGSGTICQGDTISLIASGLTTYNWAPDSELNTQTGPIVIASPTASVTYTVTGKGTGGCKAMDSVAISVNPKPNVVITATSSTTCSGTSTALTASGANTYSWSPSTGLTQTTGDTTTATITKTTTYTIIGISALGCSDTVTFTVKVNPLPTINVTTLPGTICPGDTMQLIGAGAVTYTWGPAGNITSLTGDTTYAYPDTTSSFFVTGKDSNGCMYTDTFAVTVKNITVNARAIKKALCIGDSTAINASGATNYTWSPAAGLSSTTGATVMATPTATTTYVVVGTQGQHCIDSATVIVTVNPLPVVKVSANDSSICSGSGSAILTATGASKYVWSPTTGLTTSTGSPVTATPTGSTIYTVTGTDSKGCKDTASISITVLPTPTTAITSSAGDTICPGASTTLSASGATSYAWSTGSNASSINVSPATNTTYTVIGTSAKCTDTATITIDVYNLQLTVSSASVCVGRPDTLLASATGGKSPYSYVWSSGLGTGAGPKIITVSASGSYVCTVTDGCNTTVNATATVTALPSPIPAFVESPKSILGGEYVSFENANSGATSWYWTFGEGGSSVDSFPLYQYNVPGTYIVTLVVNNQFGCADTARDTVLVTEGIYVPNVFTPNGDGQNDVFHVTAGGLKTYGIEIYNRWGERVFMADSPNIDWDGNSPAGVAESDGIYYYELKATDYANKNYDMKGYIQLIR